MCDKIQFLVFLPAFIRNISRAHLSRRGCARSVFFFQLCRSGRTESEEDAAVISAYVSMGKSIEDMGLEGVWNLKPLLDGLEIQKLLPNLPRGPVFARAIKVSLTRGKTEQNGKCRSFFFSFSISCPPAHRVR